MDLAVGLLRPSEREITASGEFKPKPAFEQASHKQAIVASSNLHLIRGLWLGEGEVNAHLVGEVEFVEEFYV